jgi:hypothetical protein
VWVFLPRSQRQRETPAHRVRSPARRTAKRAQQEHPHRQTPSVRAEEGVPRAAANSQRPAGDPAALALTLLAPEDTALHQGISPASHEIARSRRD